jgi:predicted small metal-binding protein
MAVTAGVKHLLTHECQESTETGQGTWVAIGEEFLYCVKAAGCAGGSAASGRACGLRPVPPYAAPKHPEVPNQAHSQTHPGDPTSQQSPQDLNALAGRALLPRWRAVMPETTGIGPVTAPLFACFPARAGSAIRQLTPKQRWHPRRKRNQEMKSFRCGDVVPGCTASFSGSDDEILARVAEHAQQEHQLESVPPELIAQVRAAMQPA